MEKMNYTLGRGKGYFGQFKAGTMTPRGERYFGNTPEFSFTAEQETLDHYNSDDGVRVKDESVVLQTDYMGSFVTDHISPDNLAMFFLGDSNLLTVQADTAIEETFTDVEVGLHYQLGTTDASPAGARMVANVSVTDDDATPASFTEGTDYTVDLELGRITVLEDGAITDGTNLVVTYDVEASTREQIVSRSTVIEGSLRYTAKNAAGNDIDYFMPWVKIRPNGDFALKGDEWQSLSFTVEIIKKGSAEPVYMDGRPYVA